MERVIEEIKGCIARRVYVSGPVKYGRAVCDELVFKSDGTFQSMYDAQRWVSSQGYSYGSTCALSPVGLLKGDYLIAKWRNLTRKEKYQLDGIMEGDMREGPVTVSIFYPTKK